MRRLRLAASVLLLFVLWQAIAWTHWVPESYFPGPLPTLRALWLGLVEGELARAAVLTAARAFCGAAAASVLGIALALLTVRYTIVGRAFDPLAEFLRPLPPAALVPIAIFFLGLGTPLYIFILLFACLWPVYLNASSALRGVPAVQLRTAAAFGHAGWERMLAVQLPAAAPEIFIGIRVAAAIALIATVVTEMLAGRNGLGYFLNDSAMTLRVPEMFASLLVMMLTGAALNGIVLAVRRRFVGWHVVMTATNRA